MNKITVTNMTGTPIPLSDCTLGQAETAEVNHDHTVTNYLADGYLVEFVDESEKPETKPKDGKK